MNKYSDFEVLKNGALTPELVSEAFENLPSNFIIKAHQKITELVRSGQMKKNFTKSYISKVKTGLYENHDILLVLVWVGLQSAEAKKAFSGIKKASVSA